MKCCLEIPYHRNLPYLASAKLSAASYVKLIGSPCVRADGCNQSLCAVGYMPYNIAEGPLPGVKLIVGNSNALGNCECSFMSDGPDMGAAVHRHMLHLSSLAHRDNTSLNSYVQCSCTTPLYSLVT